MNKKYVFLAVFAVLQMVLISNVVIANTFIEEGDKSGLKSLLFFGTLFTSILIFFQHFLSTKHSHLLKSSS